MIRIKLIKNIILSGLVAASLVSCDKSIEKINENPNRATDAPLTAVFNGSMVAIIQANEGENARLACMWSRQFTGTDRQYSAFNNYTITAEDLDWAGFYYAAANLDITIDKAEAEGNGFYSGVAKIVKAHSYGTLTSLWGNAPYSQAVDLVNFPAPNFDNQSDIYTAVLGLLDAGIDDLTNGVGTGTDFYFSGDKDAWLKVAHTLKARFYLHTGDYANALTETNSGIDAAAGNWLIPHTGGVYNQDMNLYNSFGTQDRQGYLTAPGAYLPTIMDTAAANPGKRNHAKTDEGERFADLYVNNGGAADDYDLNYSGSMWAATSSFPLATVNENLLIAAECEYRTGNTANALAKLNELRSILAAQYSTGTYDAFDLTDFDNGGIEDNGKGSQAENLFYEILEEKYTSLIGQIEVFCDVRRTDNFLEIQPVTGTALPERFLIPQDELDGNANAPSPIPGIFEPTPVNN